MAGYIYNDIKTDNILIGTGRDVCKDVKLIDFGLAKKFCDI